jgi:hypothetical protein
VGGVSKIAIGVKSRRAATLAGLLAIIFVATGCASTQPAPAQDSIFSNLCNPLTAKEYIGSFIALPVCVLEAMGEANMQNPQAAQNQQIGIQLQEIQQSQQRIEQKQQQLDYDLYNP